MVEVVFIAFGGAVGTALRYGVGLGMTGWLGPGFPYGTLTVNALGSFLLAVATALGAGHEVFGVDARLLVGTGVMGGFTTYSSFNLETLRMLEQGAYSKAGLYLAATLLTCLLFGAAGVAVGRWLKPA